MSEMSDELTKKQKEELQQLVHEMSELAEEVVVDYDTNPSEISGSIIRIHQDSEFLSGSLDASD
jgi:F0F1-type ATP synthase delta subunit